MRRALLGALYVLFCLEAGARALLYADGRGLLALPRQESDARCRLDWLRRYDPARQGLYDIDAPHPLYGWTLKPGLRGAGPFSAGKTRVLLVGDSFTYGEGVGERENYPAFLERALGASAEVVNLAVHGYGHDQILLRLREEGLALGPELVILGYFDEDRQRNLLSFRDFAKPRFVLRGGALVLTGVPVPSPEAAWRARFWRGGLADLGAILWSGWLRRGGLWESRSRALASALLDEMARSSAAAGARFVILDLPDTGRLEEPASDFLAAYCARRGRACFDPRPDLRRGLARGRPYARQGHYDASLNEDVAAALAGYLRRTGALRPAAKAPRAGPAGAGRP